MKKWLLILCLFLSTLGHAWYWDGAIESFEEADKLSPPAPYGILWLGSSTIRYWDLEQSFPQQKNMINRGFGGSQVEDILFYFERLVTPYHPHTIVLYSGENDLDFGKSVDQVFCDFDRLIARIARHTDAHVIWLLPKKSPARAHLWPLIDELNARILQKYSFNQRFDSIDLNSLMGLPTMNSKYFREDGIHFNAHAYQFLSQYLNRFLPR